MKHKTILQRIAAFALAVLTAFSMLPAATAYAAGEAGTVTFTYCYDSDGNMILYNGETNVDGYTAGGTGHPKPRMFVDGETAYCIQPGRHLLVNDTLYKSSSAAWNALSASQRKAIGLALLYGYQGNWSNLSGSDDEKWVATAEIIWEFVTGCRESSPPYRQVSTAIYDIQFGSNQPNYGTKAVYDTIIALMQRHNTIPSFLSTSADVASKDLEYKDGTYSLTLTDSNGVLSEFNFSSSSRAVSVTKSGNTLTISASEPFQDVVCITASRNNIPTVSSSAKIIAYGDVDLQDVVTGVENADPVYGYLNVGTPTGNIDLKKTSEDGVVAGIRFTISGEKMEQTVTTAEDGSIFVEGLVPGVYTVTEQSIDRYLPQDVQRVTVIGGRTTTVTFNNVLKRGDLVVTKTSEDGMVEGIKFHLYGTSLSDLAVDEYAITDASGKATFKDVLIGTGYTLEEVDTAAKYVVPASQKAAVEWNKVTEKSFSNILKKWNATVTKSDSATGAAQGDGTLAGAVYGVYKGDALVDSYTTDSSGQFTTDYYVCGDDWTIREISPSEGYLLNSAIYHVGAEATLYTVEYNSTANDVTEDIVKGNIAIIKHTDDGETQIETPEVGATFAVYLQSAGSYDAAKDSERDFLTCDENGFAQTKDLPYGIYTVEQVSGWDGRELMPAFDVYVAEHGQTYRYLINNAYFQSYIKVIKVDAETGNPIPYAGAGFQLYRPDGSLITQTFTYPEVTTIDTFYTNDEGYLITPEKLEYGTRYKLIEVSAPYGYVLSSEPVFFDVTADEASEDNAVTVVEVTKANMAQKGIIKVSKSGEVFATVTSKGFYQPIYEVRGLPGAVYEIRAAEDVVTLDGTLRYSAGDVVDTITTGEDGEAVSQPLYLGKYEITEITAPYGMVLNTEVRAVELVYAGQEVEITETSASFNNERQKAMVTLSKTLLADEKFGIGLHGEVATVTFGLYAAEELTAADGSTIPADGLMEIVSVNTNGSAAIRTDLPVDGKYYLKELSTDEHYLLSDQKYPIVFDYAGGESAVVEIQAKRTIKQRVEIIHVDTSSEALAVSLAEKAQVDMDYMMELTNRSEAEIVSDLRGVISINPRYEAGSGNGQSKYLPADEYLSGNVREKLREARREAKQDPESYSPNVEALEKVQPVDLTAAEISVRLGATWISPEDYEDFMYEFFGTPYYARWKIKIHFSAYTGEWNIEGKSGDRGNVRAFNTYGTDRINGYKILEQTLNLKDVRIFDYIEDADGKRTPVLNKKETAIAQAKQELIKQEFQEWIWKDPSRRERLTKLYNEKFNSVRPREYDGSHLSLAGINPEISLRQHQLNAVARGLYGGNELLGHVVGAGKTFTMVALAQESKRLGLCQKSLIVVPNHLTEQWASEYLQLYPSANILVATAIDFETKNRKRFCGRIATGDYDAIIIGHSQLEKIPLSLERQQQMLQQQMDEIMEGIMEVKRNRGDRFSIKQLERSKKQVQLKLEKLNDQSRKDDVVTFEELGIDRLFIDEAHYYKNLAAFTKMRNVGGISQTEAQKSSDLYMKCQYLDELTGGRGVVFATGTPISNTMVEMYTMQKYLQYDTLRRNDLIHFDSWASTFGETVTAIELAPEGTGYRAKTRFAKFFNLPELMTMFKEVADIQTADMLKLPVPKANYHNVVLKPSELQKKMVDGLAERAEKVRSGMVNSSQDNMLVITNDGRKLALDQSLMNELLPESETGKVVACAQNVFEIWQRTADQRSTQMIFCDLSTPHNDGHFNVYDAIRDKLIAIGIPAEEIAYIHGANTEVKKKELFGKVRSGQIRVLLGSTQKMGAGTNVQKKLIALHHLDCRATRS